MTEPHRRADRGATKPPRVLAVIPARGGSKGVPAKNLAEVAGVPLVSRAVRACRGSSLVTDVVVSTDDSRIAAVARTAGAEVVERPDALAGDLASSEAAVLHAMDTHEGRHGHVVDVVLLVQCTSPFLTAEDVEGVTRAVVEQGADSALTVAAFHGFVWRAHNAGPGDGACGAAAPARDVRGVNHDRAHRPRRQDRPQDLLETGAAYAMDAPGFRKSEHRFFGRTDTVATDPARVLEVDDPHDLARARALAPLLDRVGPSGGTGSSADTGPVDAVEATHAPPPDAAGLPGRADVDAVVLDFDGTQTDDRVYLDSGGRELVAVHRGDGLGVAALRRAGMPLLVLSTEENPVVAARAAKLRIPVLHGIERKDLALARWCEERGVAPARVLYLGNDVNDLPCFRLVGWPVAVASAHEVVRAAARVVTSTSGGAGAVREVAGWLLGPTLQDPIARQQPAPAEQPAGSDESTATDPPSPPDPPVQPAPPAHPVEGIRS